MSVEHLNRSGRRAGALNRYNSSIKEMILGALSDVGGREYLARQAEKNPTAFLGLVGKVLPLQLVGDPNNPVQWVIRVPAESTSAEEWRRLYAPSHTQHEGEVIDGQAVANETTEAKDHPGTDPTRDQAR